MAKGNKENSNNSVIDKAINAVEGGQAPQAATPTAAQQPVRPVSDAAAFKMEAARQRRANHKKLKGQKTTKIVIAPMYAPYFGKVMSVYVAGLPIFVPCNGKAYDIPKDYAMAIQKKLRAINDMLAKTQQIASVREDAESRPGHIKI